MAQLTSEQEQNMTVLRTGDPPEGARSRIASPRQAFRWTLLLAGIVLLCIAMLWLFRRTSNQAAIRKVKRELHAHLYEMRLFIDEPLLIWKAKWGLIMANVRYL